VEAKAHINEMESDSGVKDQLNKKQIENAFIATKNRFGIYTENSWLKKYYQLANRLAFINFMLDNEIQCSLLNIYFVNGWPKSERNVLDVNIWKKAINDEYSYLGINKNAQKYISEIFIEC